VTPGAARRRIHVPPSRNAYPPSRRPRAAPGGRSAPDTRSAEPERVPAFSSAAGCARGPLGAGYGFAEPERAPAFSSAAGCARGPLGAGYPFRRAGTRTRLLVGRGLRPGAARRRIRFRRAGTRTRLLVGRGLRPGAARRRIPVPQSRNAYPPSRRPRAAPGGRSAPDTRSAKPEREPAFSTAAGCARGPLGAGYTFRKAGTRTRLLVGRGLRPGAARRRIPVPQSRNAYPPSRRPRAAPAVCLGLLRVAFVGWVKGRRTHRAAARGCVGQQAEGPAASVNGGSAKPRPTLRKPPRPSARPVSLNPR